MKLSEIIERLKEKSEVNPRKGMGGQEVLVEKDLLREACYYLEAYQTTIMEEN